MKKKRRNRQKLALSQTVWADRLRVGWLNGFSGRGAARAEDAQGTPTQSRISPSIPVYEDHQFGEPRCCPAAKLTDLYRTPKCQLEKSGPTRVRQS